MKLCTFTHSGRTEAGIVFGNRVLPISEVNTRAGTRLAIDLLEFIRSDALAALRSAAEGMGGGIPLSEVELRLPYLAPPKIWCIGLNYRSHAEDLDEVQPEEPGSFMKPSSCLFEPGGRIELPPPEIASEVDAEGELGLIFGKHCREVPLEAVPEVLFGYTTTLDMTALDILRRNTRYLTRSKSFDTFFSFGPVVVTTDEVPDVTALVVKTLHNGSVCSQDTVSHMRHLPFPLVSFHSTAMSFDPGDVLSTGCPKGARIQPGDQVEALIDGVGRLTANAVRRTPRPYRG